MQRRPPLTLVLGLFFGALLRDLIVPISIELSSAFLPSSTGRHLSSVTEYFQETDPGTRNPKEQALVDLLDVLFPGIRDIDFTLPVDAYYVNLDRSVDRRQVMERTFGKIWGDKLHRHSAVDAKNKTQVNKRYP
jgi:hypothetical protein